MSANRTYTRDEFLAALRARGYRRTARWHEDWIERGLLDQGTRVGEFARQYVSGGQLIDVPYQDSDTRIERTRQAIASGAKVIYEAFFRADDVFVSVDILHRSPRASGWTVSEVKSTTSVKPAHIPDTAVQAHVLRRVGLPVHRMEVMHLNRACRHPDLTNLFTRSDVSEEVEEFLPEVRGEVKVQLAMLQKPKPPSMADRAQAAMGRAARSCSG